MHDQKIVRYTWHSISLVTLGAITGVVLCILQLAGVIDIGWFWATFPLWIGYAIFITFFVITWLVLGVIVLIRRIRKDK